MLFSSHTPLPTRHTAPTVVTGLLCLVVLLVFLVAPTRATSVRFSGIGQGGVSLTNKFQCVPSEETALQRSGTNFILLSTVYSRLTNGTATLDLYPAEYVIVLGSRSFTIYVYDTNTTVDATTLTTNVGIYITTNLLTRTTTNIVVTGTNLHFVNGLLDHVD